ARPAAGCRPGATRGGREAALTHGGDTGRTPGGPLSRQLVLSLYLPATVLALGQSMVAPVIPNLARSFGVNVAQASLVFVAVSLGAFVATIPAGYLMDRIGRRPVL